MKNPYTNPDPHERANALADRFRQAGATVIAWCHLCGVSLSITTGDALNRRTWVKSDFLWSPERGDWVREVAA